MNSSKTAYTPLLIVLLIVASFFLGSLITKVQYLEKTGGSAPSAPSAAGAQTQPPQGQTAAPQPAAKVDVAVGHLPLLGNKNAKVTIVEFSDFQCPFCRRLWKDTLPQLKKDYIDKGLVKFAYRHYPLPFHPQARLSAEGSECANEQGKFWQFHDKLFEEQEKQGQGTIQYTADDIKKWAQETGLNSDKFNQCLDSAKFAKLVSEDESAGQKAGVSGTPTLYINGKAIVGAQPFAAFKAVIDEELK